MRNADYVIMMDARLFPDADPFSSATWVCPRCSSPEHEPGCVDAGVPIRPRQGYGSVIGDTSRPNLRHDPIGWRKAQGDAAREAESNPGLLRRLFGKDAFAQDGEADSAPRKDKLVSVSNLAAALRLEVNTVHRWEADGILPPAPVRTEHDDPMRRLRRYPESYVRRIGEIAAQEGLLDTPRRHINSTNFSVRVWRLHSKMMAEHEDA
jgi:hypothetical protein